VAKLQVESSRHGLQIRASWKFRFGMDCKSAPALVNKIENTGEHKEDVRDSWQNHLSLLRHGL
jgi:hypothetical protein